MGGYQHNIVIENQVWKLGIQFLQPSNFVSWLIINHLITLQWFILSRVRCYARRKWRDLVRMIGFISTLVTTPLNYSEYSDISDLHTLHFTVAHALGLSVFTSRLLATDLNTETSTSKHYEVLFPFLVQSLWNSAALYWIQNWTSHGCLLPRTHLNRTALKTENCYICKCRYTASAPTTHGKHSPTVA
jgi:hypothetical protein